MQELQFPDGGQFEPLSDEQINRVLNEFKKLQNSNKEVDLVSPKNASIELENIPEKT